MVYPTDLRTWISCDEQTKANIDLYLRPMPDKVCALDRVIGRVRDFLVSNGNIAGLWRGLPSRQISIQQFYFLCVRIRSSCCCDVRVALSILSLCHAYLTWDDRGFATGIITTTVSPSGI